MPQNMYSLQKMIHNADGNAFYEKQPELTQLWFMVSACTQPGMLLYKYTELLNNRYLQVLKLNNKIKHWTYEREHKKTK